MKASVDKVSDEFAGQYDFLLNNCQNFTDEAVREYQRMQRFAVTGVPSVHSGARPGPRSGYQ